MRTVEQKEQKEHENECENGERQRNGNEMNGIMVEMHALLRAELFIALKLARNCTNIRKFTYKFCKKRSSNE